MQRLLTNIKASWIIPLISNWRCLVVLEHIPSMNSTPSMGNPLIFSCLCSLQALSVTSGTLKRQLIHDKQSQKHCSSHFKIKIILHGHHQTYKSWKSKKNKTLEKIYVTLPCRQTRCWFHPVLFTRPLRDQTLGGFLWQTNNGRRELLRKKKTQLPAKSQSLYLRNLQQDPVNGPLNLSIS